MSTDVKMKYGLRTGLAIFIGATILSSLLISIAMCIADLPSGVITVMITASLATACFLGGYSSSRICRHHGLIQGLICGGVPAAVIFTVSVIYNGYFTDFCLVKVIACVLFGAVGGIKGVNTRLTNVKGLR